MSGIEFDFNRDECLNLEESLKYEWLETDGCGGFASNTILDCPTRKYHGLLCVPVPQYDAVYLLLAKLETAVVVQQKVFHLSTNKFPMVFFPTGHKYIELFRGSQYPMTLYRIGDIQLRRSILMLQGEHTILVRYDLLSADIPIILQISPLLAFRNRHHLRKASSGNPFTFHIEGNLCIIQDQQQKDLPPLYLDTTSTITFEPTSSWYYQIEYLKERSRGYEYQEDLYCPGIFEIELHSGDAFIIRASTQPPEKDAFTCWKMELARRQTLLNHTRNLPHPIRQLYVRTEQFIIRDHQQQPGIIAGYPWFDQWARDTMIALPGLTLETNKPELCKEILLVWFDRLVNGVFPETWPWNPETPRIYKSPDASLWAFWTVQQYLNKTKNVENLKGPIIEGLHSILRAFIDGKAPHVSVQKDGLLWVGDRHHTYTWMDATIHDEPVTPRYGLVVEINALWYNALLFYRELCERLNIELELDIQRLADITGPAFLKRFPLNPSRGLCDCINEQGEQDEIRPNMLFAVSLPYSPFNREQKRKIIEIIVRDLLTPYGLRSLSPREPGYVGEYAGTPDKRDMIYHNGTVWPWLLGHFVEAYLSVSNNPEQARERLRHELYPIFTRHLREGCLGHVSEIMNGNPPHKLKGAFAQAWSDAEVLRAWNLLNQRTGNL